MAANAGAALKGRIRRRSFSKKEPSSLKAEFRKRKKDIASCAVLLGLDRAWEGGPSKQEGGAPADEERQRAECEVLLDLARSISEFHQELDQCHYCHEPWRGVWDGMCLQCRGFGDVSGMRPERRFHEAEKTA